MNKLFVLAAMFLSFTVHAQGVGETGGHGKVTHHHHNEQQQQQAAPQHFKTKVIHGEDAKNMFFKMLERKNKEKDLTEKCGQPERVVMYSTYRGVTKCFEIGTQNTDSLGYVCYVKTEEEISAIKSAIFNWTHNQCGLREPHQQ